MLHTIELCTPTTRRFLEDLNLASISVPFGVKDVCMGFLVRHTSLVSHTHIHLKVGRHSKPVDVSQ